jgi:DNA-binding protein YbaB
VLPGLSMQLDYLVDEALRKERDALQTKVAKMQDDIESVAAKMKDIKAKGSVVVTGGGNIVNINSAISDSFNTIEHDDPALAEALKTISGAVERSGNKEAGQAWASFMKQMTGERTNRSLRPLGQSCEACP